MQEAGLAGFDTAIWYGFFAPANTPRDIVAKLNAALGRIVQLPDVKEAFNRQGFEAQAGTPEEFAAEIRRSFDIYAKAIKLSAEAEPEIFATSHRFGTVMENVVLDPVTRTIKARATLANASRKLKGEMFVTAEIDTGGATELLVPSKALYFQSEKNYVFIDESGGKYTRRAVKASDVRDSRTEILSGLKEGEKVVVDGALMLQQMLQPRRVQK